jgi:hypothetical protein
MADYHSPTIVQPSIPVVAMTPLERLILTSVFDCEPDGDALYLFTELGPRDMFEIPGAELRAAFSDSAGTGSRIRDYLQHTMDATDTSLEFVEVDISGMSWNFILQDIVRRCQALDYIYVLTAFTCTRMRPDGFGGMVVFVTEDNVEGKSTFELLNEFITALKSGDKG